MEMQSCQELKCCVHIRRFKMNHNNRCSLGELAKKCDEKRLEIDTYDKGRVVKMKVYCKAKDMQKKR